MNFLVNLPATTLLNFDVTICETNLQSYETENRAAGRRWDIEPGGVPPQGPQSEPNMAIAARRERSVASGLTRGHSPQ
jgi:hypothetical protein